MQTYITHVLSAVALVRLLICPRLGNRHIMPHAPCRYVLFVHLIQLRSVPTRWFGDEVSCKKAYQGTDVEEQPCGVVSLTCNYITPDVSRIPKILGVVL